MLRHQLARHFKVGAPPELEAFLRDIDASCSQGEVERELAEHSLHLISQEVLARDQQLRQRAVQPAEA